LVAFYGFLLFYFKPYKIRLYNKMDILQTAVQGISVYLGFVAYQNVDELFWWVTSLVIIGIINFIFIFWSVKLLAVAYVFKLQSDIETVKMKLVKVSFCKRYCFTKKSRMHYIKKRWIHSVIVNLKVKNMINAWTGKFKVDKDKIFEILDGQAVSDLDGR